MKLRKLGLQLLEETLVECGHPELELVCYCQVAPTDTIQLILMDGEGPESGVPLLCLLLDNFLLLKSIPVLTTVLLYVGTAFVDDL